MVIQSKINLGPEVIKLASNHSINTSPFKTYLKLTRNYFGEFKDNKFYNTSHTSIKI